MPKNDEGLRLYFNTASARKTTDSPMYDKDKCICRNGVFPKKSTGYEWWERKQDGMIFLGNEGHGRLLKQLASLAPSLFTSDVPVFIPEEYISEIELRLDSNIIFYRGVSPNHVRFFDKFRLSFARWVNPNKARNIQKNQEKKRVKNQIAPLMTLDLGSWNLKDGLTLKTSMYRWDRRVDLKGAGLFRNAIKSGAGGWAYPVWDQNMNRTNHVCYKCMNHDFPAGGSCRWKNGKKMPHKNCFTSKGYFQDMLFYITDHLGLSVKLVLDNKCQNWPYGKMEKCKGSGSYLKLRAADVLSHGIGAVGETAINQRTGGYGHETILLHRTSTTLIGARPTKSHVQFWAYLSVFGLVQWLFFILLLVGFVLIMTIASKMTLEDETGSTSEMILSSISIAYLFTLQLGEHNMGRQFRIVLTLTLSMLTMLFWIYYSGDITALMTAGMTPPIPVNNFKDVLDLGYKVITVNRYMSDNFLKPHKNGTTRKDVYYKYFHNKKLTNITYQLRNCQNATACQRWKMVWHFHKKETNPFNTLLDYPDFLMFNTRESVTAIPPYKFNRLIALDLDNEAVSFTGAALWLHFDSEFLQIFNHYTMK